MRVPRRFVIAFIAAFVVVTQAHAAETVTVFAAASLKQALDEAGMAFKAKTGIDVKASYAAASTLVRQIENGAPADIFISADPDWMDYADRHGLIQPATRLDLLGNTLVVIAPKASGIETLALTATDFDRSVGDGKWTTGTVATVPCGIYAKQALTTFGMWKTAEPKLAQTDTVRTALQFVSRGEAALGIVYQTDANADPGVKVVASFPAASHAPIIYPFALTKVARGEAPGTFLAFLASDEAKPIFSKQGFILLRP